MNPATGRFCARYLPLTFALLGIACTETKTPTEPTAVVAATPTPAGPAVTLSGVVTDQSGAPYSPAVVYCQGVGSTEVSADPRGKYRLTGLKAGAAVVKVYAQGQQKSQDFDVVLSVGDNVKDLAINIVTGEPASMSGFVRLPSGEPAPSAILSCQRKGVNIGADGSYALTGLYAGRWNVSLTWNGYNDEEYETVTLRPGANTVNFVVGAPPPAAWMSGIVTSRFPSEETREQHHD